MAAAIAQINENIFKTTSELDINPNTRIISLSDIHGDIDALIIALRDCANIIVSRDNLPNSADNRRDPELDRLLSLDLTNKDNMLEFNEKCELNFNWNGDTTHVVLVGDTIDPVRRDGNRILQTALSDTNPTKNINNIYPQAEIKILKFLNKLDKMASTIGGRVIKLLGNHEMSNFQPRHLYPELYSHNPNEEMPYLDSDGNIATIQRRYYFNLDNPGFNLFMERGSGVFIRINNIFFMHGQLYNSSQPYFTYNNCIKINQWLNTQQNHTYTWEPSYDLFLNFLYRSPQLNDRIYGESDNIHRRIVTNTTDSFCSNVDRDIQLFLNDHPNKDTNPNLRNIKIVIGHCPQYNSTYSGMANRTLKTKTNDTNRVILTSPAETFVTDAGNVNDGNVFGISMECPFDPADPNNPHHKIYRVDVGVSRAFDTEPLFSAFNNKKISMNEENLKRYFLSRVPQVLELQGDTVRILRTTLKNTRTHQYKDKFENIVNSDPAYDKFKIENITFGGYKQKYLKYKAKYIELKNKLNTN